MSKRTVILLSFSRRLSHSTILSLSFPVTPYHEITPIAADTHDFGGGQLTTNGWVRSYGEDGTVGEYKGEGKVRTARLRKGKGLSLSLVHKIHVPLQTDSRALLIVDVILHTRGRPRLGSQ